MYKQKNITSLMISLLERVEELKGNFDYNGFSVDLYSDLEVKAYNGDRFLDYKLVIKFERDVGKEIEVILYADTQLNFYINVYEDVFEEATDANIWKNLFWAAT